MKSRYLLGILFLFSFLLPPSPAAARQTEVYLSIAKQVNPKVKVILAPFALGPGGSKSADALRKNILKDMDLSGVLIPIGEGAMLAEAEQADRVADRILFANWGRFGAEALVKVADSSTLQQCDFQVRAFAMQDQAPLVAKRYRGSATDQKRLVHAMINDLVLALTGSEGIALSKTAFVSDATGHKEIYTMDYDGENVRRLSTDRSLFLYPRWSPDAKKIVAVSYLRGKPNLCLIDVARGSRTFIAKFPGLNTGGAWSPDGKSIALTLSKDGNPEIYRLDIETGALQRLTRNSAVDSSPTWSPDGAQIAFVSNRGGSVQIYRMNADGSEPRRITTQGGYNTSPAWSPKGNFIAYCTMQGKNFQIFVSDVRNGTSYPITQDNRNNEDPTWAPDGRHLVYSSSKNYRSDIFMIDIYDQRPVQLTRQLGSCVSPSWSSNISK